VVAYSHRSREMRILDIVWHSMRIRTARVAMSAEAYSNRPHPRLQIGRADGRCSVAPLWATS
jgi:hypothetical protein